MDKILVKVYVPMIEEQYDIKIPINRKIYSVIALLVKAVNDLSNGYYNPVKMPILYDRITGKPFDMNLNVKESKIKNGMEIVLI